jgi:MFS superfamily sulfate permease-like transporter
MATKQVTSDLFPERTDLTVKKIGITYSLMNLIVPFWGGVPVCHGAGGMIGHYTFGGRTGGSVIIYGLFYIGIGIFFGNSFEEVIKVFPLPILGVILLVEGISLMLLVRDTVQDKKGFIIAILVGALAFGLPYGFMVSMLVGTTLYYLPVRLEALKYLGVSSQEKSLNQ